MISDSILPSSALPIVIAVCLLMAFALGWELAVGRYRKREQARRDTQRRIQQRMAEIEADLDTDVFGAGLHMGIEGTLDAFDNLSREIRDQHKAKP